MLEDVTIYDFFLYIFFNYGPVILVENYQL